MQQSGSSVQHHASHRHLFAIELMWPNAGVDPRPHMANAGLDPGAASDSNPDSNPDSRRTCWLTLGTLRR
jgi:hypothetical protein